MPETPDFEQIARQLFAGWLEDSRFNSVATASFEATIVQTAEQLRQVWNARGAALIDPVTNAVDEWVRAGGGTYDELQAVVEQAIKELNR